MIPISVYSGKKLALFGLGISGLSAARALQAGGAEPILWDENAERREAASEAGFKVADLHDLNWGEIEALVLSPGVPLTHPEPHWSVKLAQTAKVPIIGDTELFFQEFLVRGHADKVIAITGTNGKSTTTALTTHILKAAGVNAVMGGNIGVGVLDLPDFGKGRAYVLELSSYQIDLTLSLCPTVAGLLNITPDHIERHGSIEHYVEVKGRIFSQLGSDQRAVISLDDRYCQQIALSLPSAVESLFVSRSQEITDGVLLGDEKLIVRRGGKDSHVIELGGIAGLRGQHNLQNAAFAFLLCSKITDNTQGLIEGFKNFPGLAHRMEQIARYKSATGEVLFINDSKATNADASEQALKSFKNIYWIAGGQSKDGGINSLRPFLSEMQKAYLIGEAAGEFGEIITQNSVQFEDCKTMEVAVMRAFEDACAAGHEEAAILLSPAAASFDQYANFEIRGEAFKKIVTSIDGIEIMGDMN